MSTIGGRDIALEIWREEKERKLHEEQQNEALIHIKNADLGDRAKDFEVDIHGLTHLSLTKAREVWLGKQQRQGESRGEAIARLIDEGEMAFPPKS